MNKKITMMKKVLISLAGAFTIMSLASCGGGANSDSTSDSTSMTTTGTSGSAATDANTSGSSSNYVDIYTGSKVSKDEQTGKYLNAETRVPIEYYFDPSTHDTFDVNGRLVNSALIKGADGKYTVDEAKIKFQSDGDVKMKSADGDTKVKLETNGDGKIKTDSSKIKVKNGEIKVKS